MSGSYCFPGLVLTRVVESNRVGLQRFDNTAAFDSFKACYTLKAKYPLLSSSFFCCIIPKQTVKLPSGTILKQVQLSFCSIHPEQTTIKRQVPVDIISPARVRPTSGIQLQKIDKLQPLPPQAALCLLNIITTKYCPFAGDDVFRRMKTMDGDKLEQLNLLSYSIRFIPSSSFSRSKERSCGMTSQPRSQASEAEIDTCKGRKTPSRRRTSCQISIGRNLGRQQAAHIAMFTVCLHPKLRPFEKLP